MAYYDPELGGQNDTNQNDAQANPPTASFGGSPDFNERLGPAVDNSSVEQQLKDAAKASGVAYDPSDYEGFLRNTSYASGGSSSADALANQLAIYKKRAQPTASGGGSGGSADPRGTGKVDPGWVKNAGGQYVNTLAPGFDPASLGANTSPMFTDPSQQLLESYALNRFNQLQNPSPSSGTGLYEQYAKDLVAQLKQAPYTQGDEATIKAGAYNAISQDEQTTTQQWMEEISKRGMAPSSGPALAGLQKIKESFNQLRANVDQQFATNAINLGRSDRLQALDVLGNLQASENTRLNNAGNFARIPYDLGTDSFNQNLQAVNAGGSPQANAQSAIQLAMAIQNSNEYTSQQKAQYIEALYRAMGLLG